MYLQGRQIRWLDEEEEFEPIQLGGKKPFKDHYAAGKVQEQLR